MVTITRTIIEKEMLGLTRYDGIEGPVKVDMEVTKVKIFGITIISWEKRV